MAAGEQTTAGVGGQGFLRWVELVGDRSLDTGDYPFCLPVVHALRRGRLDLDPSMTFLTGDNGTGKSTLVEAIAIGLG